MNNINKKKIIDQFKLHDNDKGSMEIQIALLSHDINILTEHLNNFKKDFHSKVGLIKKVNKRKKLLKYLKNKNRNNYTNIINKLNIRK